MRRLRLALFVGSIGLLVAAVVLLAVLLARGPVIGSGSRIITVTGLENAHPVGGSNIGLGVCLPGPDPVRRPVMKHGCGAGRFPSSGIGTTRGPSSTRIRVVKPSSSCPFDVKVHSARSGRCWKRAARGNEPLGTTGIALVDGIGPSHPGHRSGRGGVRCGPVAVWPGHRGGEIAESERPAAPSWVLVRERSGARTTVGGTGGV